MSRGSMNPGDYKSQKSPGSKRKKTTPGSKDPVYKEAVKDSPTMKGKCA